MKPGSSRGMPTRVKLALLGAVLSLGALALPWMGSRLDAIPGLLGYQDTLPWVVLRVVAAIATIVLALPLVKLPDLRETQRVVFGASAVVFVLRPVLLILQNPTTSDLSTSTMKVEQVYSPSWGILASFVAAAVMVVATVLTHRSDDVREAAEREAARAALLEDPELAAFAGPPPAPLITPSASAAPTAPTVAAQPEPTAPTRTEPAVHPEPVAHAPAPTVVADPEPFQAAEPPHDSPQPAPLQETAPAATSQQHPRAPMHDHSPYRPAASAPLENAHLAMPVVLGDTGPYGPDGPSRLGDGPNLVQVEDTLAPKAAAPAPHLALMQQPPAPVAPPTPPAPVAQQPPVVPPAAPAAPAEPRPRSVAPPGFG